MKHVERASAQRRAETGSDAEEREHHSVNRGVGLEAEIATDEERHQIDLCADAHSAQDCANKRSTTDRTTTENGNANHRDHEEAGRDVGSPIPIEAPAGKNAAKDDGQTGQRKCSACCPRRNALVGKEL